MNGFWWVVWLVAVIAIAVWAIGGANRRRNKALRLAAESGGLDQSDWDLIADHLEALPRLPDDLRERLGGITSVLIEEKNFEACGGLEKVTREMKLVIMVQAAFLLVGRNHKFYPKLRSILVYPAAYSSKDEHGEEEQTRLGESWESGSVVLSWRSVQRGGEDGDDGHNVVIHEFAHQLDQENRAADGLPQLSDRRAVGKWAHAFSAAFEDFCNDLDHGRKTVLDPYGATNPAEFFAVATETFFEKPKQLKRDYAALYDQLKTYYGLDPISW